MSSDDDDGGIGDLIEGVCDLLAELPLALWPIVIAIVLVLVFLLHH